MVKIAIVSMVKAPLHELRIFVHYHLNIGIDEIILLFDDPQDPGLQDLSQIPRVTCIACTSEYWQSKVGERPDIFSRRQFTSINEGVNIAADKGCNWVVQLDSDELVKPSTDIRGILESCSADVLRFKVLEAVSEQENYENIFTATLFRNESSKTKIRVAKLLGCSRAFYQNEYFRGHTVSKVAVKLSSRIQTHGVHGPKQYDRKTTSFENTNEVALLHFDCVGFDSWNRKWGGRANGSCISVTMRENREQQLQAYIEVTKAGRLAQVELYKRLHIITGYEKGVLFLLGMLKRVRIKQSLLVYLENTTAPREYIP
jgi:hypothetical protein